MAVRVIQARPIVGNTVAPPAQKLRVAAYARISTDDDSQETSLAGQMAYFENLIKGNDEWSYAGLYFDDGISGTSTKKREGFNRMMADCEAGLIDKILAKSISRFSRNVVDCITALRRCRELGVEVYFEKENLSSMDPTADLLLTIMSSLSQQESASISANVAMGIRYRFQQGVQMINCSRFLGYKKNPVTKDLEIEPEGAQTVRLIFRWFLEGHSDIEIARKLRSMNALSGSGRTDWPVVTVTYMLQNERYAGDSLLQKTLVQNFLTHKSIKNKGQLPQYYVENSHPPIIPREVFNLAQAIVHTSTVPMAEGTSVREGTTGTTDGGQKKMKAILPKKYALTGKLVCGCCGQPFKRFANKRDGDTWKCMGRVKGECNARIVKERDVKAVMTAAFQNLIHEESIVLRVQAQARLLLDDVEPRLRLLLAESHFEGNAEILHADDGSILTQGDILHADDGSVLTQGDNGSTLSQDYNSRQIEIIAAKASKLYVGATSLLELIETMKGRVLETGDPDPGRTCLTIEDFLNRTREEILVPSFSVDDEKDEPAGGEAADGEAAEIVADSAETTHSAAIDEELVKRYVDKVVVGGRGLEVRFKGGISF